MNTEELFNQINIASQLLREYQSRVLSIIKLIRDSSKYEKSGKNEVDGWNRFNYYSDDPVSKFELINGYEYPIMKANLKENKGWIQMEILHVMNEESSKTPLPSPVLLVMFTYQKEGFEDWPSWISPQNNEWIWKTIEKKKVYTQSASPIKTGPKDSIFIALPILMPELMDKVSVYRALDKVQSTLNEIVSKQCGVDLPALFDKL